MNELNPGAPMFGKESIKGPGMVEELVKKEAAFRKFMELSPSVPNGFDMNSTNVNLNDFSTIICHCLLSNEHLLGLREQGYMDLPSRLESYRHKNTEDQEYLVFKNG